MLKHKPNWQAFVLCAALGLVMTVGAEGRAAAPPRTVVDFYLLLPTSYFDNDSVKERLRLCHGADAVIDIKNGYLRTWGDGAQRTLTVCLFRRSDHSYLVAVNTNRASDGDWEPILDFYRYRHGRLVHAFPSPLPRQFSEQLGYRLPRYGATVEVIDEAGRTRYGLLWADNQFRVQGAASRRLLVPISPASKLPKSLYEQRDYPSPDHEYIARLRHDEGDVWNLAIIGSRSRQSIATADDVMNLAWAPGRGHRLVVATCGIYGEAMLGQWEGSSRWRALYPVRRPDQECFVLYRIAADGRSILYGHDTDLEHSSDGKRNPLDRKHWLRLPP